MAAAAIGCFAASRESQLRAILAEQAAAWNRGDVDGFMQHYWKSADLTFSSGGKTERGWQQTMDRYKRRYPTRDEMGRLTFDFDSHDELGPDSSLVLGRWFLAREKSPVGGNFSLVFRRVAGAWVIAHDHTSVLPDALVVP